MIDPKSLRIGNILDAMYQRPDGTGKVWIPVTVDSINRFMNTITTDLGQSIEIDEKWLRPIPLSPSLLERAGFKDRSGSLANRLGFGISINSMIELCWYVMGSELEGIRVQTKGSGFTMDTGIRTFHQLQNLYYSLTGQELELKP